MGTIFALTCPDCQYSKKYFCGVGMLDYLDKDEDVKIPAPDEFQNIVKRQYTHKSIKEQILSGYYGHEIKRLFLSYPENEWYSDEEKGRCYPFYCSKCRKVRYRHPKSMQLRHENSYTEYDIPQKCSVCNSLLLSPFRGIDKVLCPKCGSVHVSIGHWGLWD